MEADLSGIVADGKWIIEGTGVEPDITVEQEPNAGLEVRDPQLAGNGIPGFSRIPGHPLRI